MTTVIPIRPVNVDVNLPAKFFASETQVYVTSYFNTIQGEGPFAGVPATFLRLAGCNFGAKAADGFCPFCDTSFQIDRASKFYPKDLAAVLTELMTTAGTELLVITGGEPTLQPLVIQLLAFMPQNVTFQFETNGTNPGFWETLGVECRDKLDRVRVVVSPKANYISRKYAPVNPTVAGYADAFKFLLDANPDSPHHEIPDWALKTKGSKVYVSPITVYRREPVGEVSSIWDPTLVNHELTQLNYEYAAEYAMKHHLLLSLQTHLFTAIP